MEKFKKLGLSEQLLKAIQEEGFEAPREIQNNCGIPPRLGILHRSYRRQLLSPSRIQYGPGFPGIQFFPETANDSRLIRSDIDKKKLPEHDESIRINRSANRPGY